MNTKKTVATIIISLYFVTYWVISGWESYSHIQIGDSWVYARHNIAAGYFSMRAYLVQYIVPLLLYILLMMQEDKAYIVIRYIDREEIWRIKIYGMMKYVFQFTLIHFGVDIVLMLCTYPLEGIINSRILIYLGLFFPNVLFYFIFFATIFLMLQVILNSWKALVFTSGLAVLYYLSVATGLILSWNPLFFLILLGVQVQRGINEADLILAYTYIFTIDIIVILTGLKLYHKKEFSYSYERDQLQKCVKNE